MTPEQRRRVEWLAGELGFLHGGIGNLAWRERIKTYGVTSHTELTEQQAADLIYRLEYHLRERSGTWH